MTSRPLPPKIAFRPAWLAGLALVAAGCAPGEEADPTNLLLVSLDTLRADRVGAYGYDRDTTPFLDSLAEESVLFERVSAPSSRTASSHMSMFTGLRPGSHGVINYVSEEGVSASRDLPLLGELLEEEGFTNVAFTGGGMMRGELGFSRGFEIYDHSGGGAEPVFERAENWLRERPTGDVPFFLFVHTYEIHDPYTPPVEWQDRFAPNYKGRMNRGGTVALPGDEKSAAEHLSMFADERKRFWNGFNPNKQADLDHVSSLYDAGVAYTDHLLGEFYQVVRELELEQNLLTVVVSDHGEAFMDHGFISHRTIHQEILEVPLIVRLRGAEHSGLRVTRQIEGIDLFPSLLELLDIEVPEHVQGRSFLPDFLDPSRQPAQPWSELAGPNTDMAALRNEDWKLIAFPSATEGGALFNLSDDPREKRNRAEDEPELTESLRKQMKEIAAENLALLRRFPPLAINLDEQGLRELQALGYADDVPEPTPEGSSSGTGSSK